MHCIKCPAAKLNILQTKMHETSRTLNKHYDIGKRCYDAFLTSFLWKKATRSQVVNKFLRNVFRSSQPSALPEPNLSLLIETLRKSHKSKRRFWQLHQPSIGSELAPNPSVTVHRLDATCSNPNFQFLLWRQDRKTVEMIRNVMKSVNLACLPGHFLERTLCSSQFGNAMPVNANECVLEKL